MVFMTGQFFIVIKSDALLIPFLVIVYAMCSQLYRTNRGWSSDVSFSLTMALVLE
jgi:hypothetical protein